MLIQGAKVHYKKEVSVSSVTPGSILSLQICSPDRIFVMLYVLAFKKSKGVALQIRTLKTAIVYAAIFGLLINKAHYPW